MNFDLLKKIKEVFELTINKIIFTILLFILSIIISVFLVYFEVYFLEIGIPLKFYRMGFGVVGLGESHQRFNYLNLFINIIFWYFLACLLINYWNRYYVKPKRKIK